jgi:hypothetical protein
MDDILRRLFYIALPHRMANHIPGEISLELICNVVSVLPVSIEDTEDQSVCGGICVCDHRILVLFTRIVGRMTFRGDAVVIIHGTVHMRLRLRNDTLHVVSGRGRAAINKGARPSDSETTTDLLKRALLLGFGRVFCHDDHANEIEPKRVARYSTVRNGDQAN